MVHVFLKISALVFALVFLIGWVWPPALWSLVLGVPLFIAGLCDALQKRRAVLRNFPIIGRFRYFFEMIRPEINQYFVESNTDGTPFSREQRSMAYQRAKRELDTMPFGTQRDVYEVGYEWINHSIAPKSLPHEPPRIRIGGKDCKQPYDASLLNISAMSFGSLSDAAVLALNGGAKLGNFYHNTGEGGVSPYHLKPGGDLCWQIGTGYFGCRTKDGNFCPETFAEQAAHPNIKLIELKLSQGAKPGHGGILPAGKLTQEIAEIRKVGMGQDVLSPPGHSAFQDPAGLLKFIGQLRELSGGKPVGFKLCVGCPIEFVSIALAMKETGILPDFISVDGGEGGTGAAPVEFSNHIGAPLTDGLMLVHNVLRGFGLRQPIKIIASGKILGGFSMASRLAAGADLCSAARSFMFSLGCIQARRCNSNDCPVGVATQKRSLIRGLVVEDKLTRVASFHDQTLEALLELLGAAGLDHPDHLKPSHIMRRVSETVVKPYSELFDFLEDGELLGGDIPEPYATWIKEASPGRFGQCA